MTEKEMRDSEVPKIRGWFHLFRYIRSLIKQRHDYGTCVYAMSMAATAVFNFVASRLGVTGFQASCADLDIIRRTRRIKGPFMIIDLENALYPQYDLHAKLREFIADSKDWLKEEAQKKLLEDGPAHPDVRKHWEDLAA